GNAPTEHGANRAQCLLTRSVFPGIHGTGVGKDRIREWPYHSGAESMPHTRDDGAVTAVDAGRHAFGMWRRVDRVLRGVDYQCRCGDPREFRTTVQPLLRRPRMCGAELMRAGVLDNTSFESGELLR